MEGTGLVVIKNNGNLRVTSQLCTVKSCRYMSDRALAYRFFGPLWTLNFETGSDSVSASYLRGAQLKRPLNRDY